MKISLTKLEKCVAIDKLIIHSLDLCLYQASVIIDGDEYFVCHDDGNFLRTHSLIDIQKYCRNLKVRERVLRQESAYDEMVGGPSKTESNAMEVPLKDHELY
ncbi:hypothetical protein AL542_02340 [Grimontia hollisae]|uniref:Na(+)-translocating NADH-quinone reductase subunit B n=2 Tax=Grimontia hollisae TaxID=673 RepID=D0I5B5_GRIHO|nr:DUF6482 family protein [Grimontia hollisae]AMG29297.1 hypothetical protein AL542_02340 [Grimontia hollisae]EEY73079.1 hypothetical protein VHA_000932 [Grimontia hollisae CIP 101886]MDF2183920.1 DUF6482 family protein [Grimontia hollisae]STO77762.1 Uncharacterised protein [Grimontia hollisae]STO98653.1 Uncharacterised protein [Grimontia hollisae]